MGHDDEPTRVGEPGDDLVQDGYAVHRHVGRRLVQQEQRRRGEGGAGEGEPRPLTGRQAEPVVPEPGVQPVPVSQLRPQPDLGQRRGHRGVGRVRGGGREVVAHGARQQQRPLRRQVRRGGADRPGRGGAQPREQLQHRRLAGPAGPGQHGQAGPGRRREGQPVQGADPAGVGVGDLGEPDGPPGRCRRTGTTGTTGLPQHPVVGQLLQHLRPVGGVVELGADPADRPVRLGRQQDRGEPDDEVHPAVRQPQPDRHRHHRHRDRRQQLQRGRRQEGRPQRGDARPPVPLPDLAHHVHLRSRPPVGHQRRQAPHHVEEVPGQQLHRAPPALRLIARVHADERREDRQQRQRQHDDERAPRVHHHEGDQRQRRHHGRGDERGEVAGDIRLEGGDPVGGAGERDLGARPPLHRPRQPVPQQRLPHDPDHAQPGAPGDQLARAGEQPARHQQRDQPAEVCREFLALAPHHRADDEGEGHRLRDRDDPREDADDGQRGHRAAGRREGPQQVGVEGSHRLSVAGRAGARARGSTPAVAASRQRPAPTWSPSTTAAWCTCVGMWCPETRLRKVQ